MPERLTTLPTYNQERTADFFAKRNWNVHFLEVDAVTLVDVDEDASLECIDGRRRKKPIKKHGYKIPGASNAILATRTGADPAGRNEAAKATKEILGQTPGFHIDCGQYNLAIKQKYSPELGLLTVQAEPVKFGDRILKPSEVIKMDTKRWNGKFYDDYEGPHEETGAVLNPFLGTTIDIRTIEPRGSRFLYDHAALVRVVQSETRALMFFAETIENLAPERTNVEILTTTPPTV